MVRTCSPARRLALIALIALAALAAVAGPRFAHAAEGDSVWNTLQRGTHVILVRHGKTTPGVGDPPGFKLGDCSTQRNLNDEGREQARKMGETFRARRIEVDRVMSSPWCRCVETAELAFKQKPEITPALGGFFDEPEKREPQVAALRKLVNDHRGPGNLVLVTHGNNITALIGVAVEMGSVAVVKSEGSGKITLVGTGRLP